MTMTHSEAPAGESRLKARLQGRVVIVTGAGRGFGHGIARKLAEYGATVVALALEDDELGDLARTIRSMGGTVETHAVDLGNRDATIACTDRIGSRHGGVDALVNAAAILRMRSFVDLTEAEFEATIDVNLLSATRLIRAFLPGMIERGEGAIVNVTSAAGIRPFLLETEYCAAKYGLEGFSFSLAMELAEHNVSVNLVSPGYRIKPTSVTAAEFAGWPPERRAEYRDPVEMSDAFAFLSMQFPNERGITGQRFNAYDLTNAIREHGWGWRPGPASSA